MSNEVKHADPQRIRELELEIYGHTWGTDAIDNHGRPWPLPLPPPLPANTYVTGTSAAGNPTDPYQDWQA
jgi:hypothetical protein